MYCVQLLSYDLWAILRLLSPYIVPSGIQSTVIESCNLWSKRSSTKPPWLDHYSKIMILSSVAIFFFSFFFFPHSSISTMRGLPTFELFFLLCSLVVLAYAYICLGVLNLIMVSGRAELHVTTVPTPHHHTHLTHARHKHTHSWIPSPDFKA